MADWQRAYEIELAQNPTGRSRPFTAVTPPKYCKIKKIRPGFEEFIEHPAHGRPVPRCQASRKRSGGKVQCAKFAIRGKHLCRTHGGAVGSGRLTDQGRLNQKDSVTVHGQETVLERSERSRILRELREIERIGKVLGFFSGKGSRGPYNKSRTHASSKRK